MVPRGEMQYVKDGGGRTQGKKIFVLRRGLMVWQEGRGTRVKRPRGSADGNQRLVNSSEREHRN
jgi:hypothetical protein